MSTLNPYLYAYNPELLAFENAWVNFVKRNEINEAVIKPEIAASWKRCKNLNLNPLSMDAIPLVPDDELAERIAENKRLLEVVTPFMDTLCSIMMNTGFHINFADRDGVILKCMGDEDSKILCAKVNSRPGAPRAEHVAGTNSISLAMESGKSVQVAGAEHYMQIFHRAACSAAPIILNNGEFLGTLSITGRYELIHKHTLGMVAATVEAIKNKIHTLQMNEQLLENNSQLHATLGIITDGVVYIKEGKITQLNQEMCNFIGKKSEDLIGKSAESQIITTPDLSKILGRDHNYYRDGEVLLRGAHRNYKCLYAVRDILEDRGSSIGKVMLFTRIEEIELLVSKIKNLAKYKFSDIIGESPAIKRAIDLAERASAYDSRVIIEGESGTGKEMFAQAIHNNSNRKDGPFIAIDCGTLPKELLESQLFGYEGGSFTGARKEGKAGIFELANRGTIFLDEIGNMHPEMQIKLLRVLQEGTFTRVGGTEPIRTDARIIAATNADLQESVRSGTFRQDLYYRLNVFYINTPPLRERKEDIPLLVNHFLKTNDVRRRAVVVDKKALNVLMNYDWPGNIRQLNNIIERALILINGSVITTENLPIELFQDEDLKGVHILKAQMTLDEAMREYIKFVLKLNQNNISKTARLLNVSRTTVYKLMNDDSYNVDIQKG